MYVAFGVAVGACLTHNAPILHSISPRSSMCLFRGLATFLAGLGSDGAAAPSMPRLAAVLADDEAGIS